MMDFDIPPPFDQAWFMFLFGWIIGACLGSFGTMLAYRLPRNISIIAPRSHCPTCTSVLGPRDLVPIFSWVFSKGRCQHCKAPIGARYVLIEVATSFSCALLSAWVGFSPVLVFGYVFVLALVVSISIMINKRVST